VPKSHNLIENPPSVFYLIMMAGGTLKTYCLMPHNVAEATFNSITDYPRVLIYRIICISF